jgi:hypothetical protein
MSVSVSRIIKTKTKIRLSAVISQYVGGFTLKALYRMCQNVDWISLHLDGAQWWVCMNAAIYPVFLKISVISPAD